MAQTVLDSNDLDAIIADATGEAPQEADKPKEEPKVEAKTEPKEESDDLEGEDGLTPRQKRELTAKMQTAIGKKHRALKDAEEFATEQYNERRLAEERAQTLTAQLEEIRKQNVPRETLPVEPKRENFKTDAEYADALIDYRVDRKLKAKAEADEKLAAERRQEEILATAKGRIAQAIELVPDFVEVTEAVDWPTPPAIAGYMQESDMFAELGYYLAQHSDERSRLEKLSPQRQLVEIGKIESKLEPFSAKTEKVKLNGSEKPSQGNGALPSETVETPSQPRTAPVIKPLSSGSAIQVEKAPHERNYAEEKAAWQRKQHVNLAKRSRH
jgi:hypothetical protein